MANISNAIANKENIHDSKRTETLPMHAPNLNDIENNNDNAIQ